MNATPKKRGQTRKRRRFWLLAALVALLVFGALGVFLKVYYPKINSERLMRKTREYMEKKDFQSAVITAQRALQIDDHNADAARVLVEVAEIVKNPAVVGWKKRLVELEPGSLANRLSLAQTALDAGQFAIAEEALAGARELGKGRVPYHALAGRAALLAKDTKRVEEEFSEASRLEPENVYYRFQVDSLRLRSTDSELRAAARVSLENMLDQPGIFTAASRALISDALSRGDVARALELADGLKSAGTASFQDRLVYLEILYRRRLPNYATHLATLQDEAAANPEHVFGLISWLNEHRSALVAIDWSKRLPATMRATMPVPIALAQAHARLKDWTGIKPIIDGDVIFPHAEGEPQPEMGLGRWGQAEFLRHAFQAVVRRSEGDPQQGKVQWTAAIRAAGDRPATIATLARYAVEWGWEDEATDMLWKVVRTAPDPRWALRILYTTYEQTQSTGKLLQVANEVLKVEPNNRDMKNNVAMLNLLQGTNVAEAVESIRELQRLEPQNPDYVTTYSFGLYLQGFTKQALDLLKTLKPERLEDPSVAGYYGLVLSATEAKEESRRFLEFARDARLLPEERKLIAQAWDRVKTPAAAGAPPPVQ